MIVKILVNIARLLDKATFKIDSIAQGMCKHELERVGDTLDYCPKCRSYIVVRGADEEHYNF